MCKNKKREATSSNDGAEESGMTLAAYLRSLRALPMKDAKAFSGPFDHEMQYFAKFLDEFFKCHGYEVYIADSFRVLAQLRHARRRHLQPTGQDALEHVRVRAGRCRTSVRVFLIFEEKAPASSRRAPRGPRGPILL